MALKHSVYDTDTHFLVDPITRCIKNDGSAKTLLVQGDINSERFSFEVPRKIEGHDMSQCDEVQVHFINIDVQTKAQSCGVYTVDDLEISTENPDKIVLTWLIAGEATKYVGSLNFVLRFTCYQKTNTSAVAYAWNTCIHKDITVSDGIYNGEAIAEEFNDILKAWELELKANQVVSLEQTQVGDGDGGLNVWTATFGDGRTSEMRVRNGSKGETGLVGSIETVDGKALHFFHGTHAQYDALPAEKKLLNLLTIYTDGPSLFDIDTKEIIGPSELYIESVQAYVVEKVAEGSKLPFFFNATWKADQGDDGLKATAVAWSTDAGFLHLLLSQAGNGVRYFQRVNGTWAEVSVARAKQADKATQATTANKATTAEGAPVTGVNTEPDNNEGRTFEFGNTNGFGTKEGTGLWRLWNVPSGDADDPKYYAGLIPSHHDKMSLGTEERRVRNLHAKYINAEHIVADRIEGAVDAASALALGTPQKKLPDYLLTEAGFYCVGVQLAEQDNQVFFAGLLYWEPRMVAWGAAGLDIQVGIDETGAIVARQRDTNGSLLPVGYSASLIRKISTAEEV